MNHSIYFQIKQKYLPVLDNSTEYPLLELLFKNKEYGRKTDDRGYLYSAYTPNNTKQEKELYFELWKVAKLGYLVSLVVTPNEYLNRMPEKITFYGMDELLFYLNDDLI